MDFNLEKFLKRYVWDDEKTPYFTPSRKLNRRQAHFEALAYSVFVCVLFGAVALASLTGAGGQPRAEGVALYGFTIICAGVIFGFTKHYYAALWLSTAPAGAIGYLLVYGFKPKWAGIDQAVVIAFVLVWIFYSIRIVAIGRRFEHMSDGPTQS
ncbi:MAG: hypothetical protein AAF458_23455 [Pseudomonadota bacterium]